MKSTSTKKSIIYNTFYQILTLIIPFVTAPYISRVIGASGVGIYSYTTSIQTYFSMFAALGTVSYGAREIARNRDDKYKRSKLFLEIELLTVITTFICLLLWLILIGVSSDYKIYYIILTMNLFNTMFDISWFYTGLEQFKYTIIQNSIFKILGVVALFIFIKDSNDLVLYVIIMSLSTLLGTMSMWTYLPKFLQKVKFKELNIKQHFKETLVYFIPTIATSAYTVLDKTLIGVITNDAKENGYYEQATKIINIAKAITFTSLNTVFGSRISYLFAEKKEEEIRKKINISINYILFIGIGICFGLIAVANKFIPIFFGEGYERTAILVKILSPLVIIIGISNCLGSQYYTPAGLRNKSAKIIIFGAFMNLILNLILIPKFWGIGAALATIVAELTITLMYLKYSNGYSSLKMVLKLGWKKLISGIVMLMGVSLVDLMNISEFATIILQVGVGVLIYILSLVMLKDSFILDIFEKGKERLKHGK